VKNRREEKSNIGAGDKSKNEATGRRRPVLVLNQRELQSTSQRLGAILENQPK
jgi:hypothetical protein